MSGGGQGEEKRATSYSFLLHRWVTLPGPCPACIRPMQAGAQPCKRSHITLSMLPFPGADWPLQTHPRGLFPSARAEQRPDLTLGTAQRQPRLVGDAV